MNCSHPSEITVVFVRFGDLPPDGKSKNYLTGENELGVSCYEAVVRNGRAQVILPRLEESVCVSLSGVLRRPMYLIEGNVIGIGSDGEPLLSPCRIIEQLSQ